MSAAVAAELVRRVTQACAVAPGGAAAAAAVAAMDALEAELLPSLGRAGGALLEALGRARGVQRVLEVGTFFGYSAIRLAAHGARVTSIELSAANAAVARQVVCAAGLAERVHIVEGDAVAVLGALRAGRGGERFDLLFLDHAKRAYLPALLAAEPLLRPGALLVADNVASAAARLGPFLRHVHDPRLYSAPLAVRLPPRAARAAPDALLVAAKL